MHIEITDVTPATAKDILRGNTHNRNLRDKYVAILARDMAEGRWFSNGETIKVATDGTVLDGQHRLQAAILADYTMQDVVLVLDLPVEAQATIDIGRGRSAADNLGLSGYKNAAVLASTARRAWQWEHENWKFSNTTSPTHTEIADFAANNPRIQRSAEIASSTYHSFRSSKQSVTGTAHFILLGIDPAATALFFAQFAHGAGLEEGHPVLTLRNRFMNDRALGKKNPFHQDIGLTFRAWNAVREGRTLLKILHTATEPMVMPVK